MGLGNCLGTEGCFAMLYIVFKSVGDERYLGFLEQSFQFALSVDNLLCISIFSLTI